MNVAPRVTFLIGEATSRWAGMERHYCGNGISPLAARGRVSALVRHHLTLTPFLGAPSVDQPEPNPPLLGTGYWVSDMPPAVGDQELVR